MIANKILPALYILELENEAANLDFLLGENFGIQQITIGSFDFQNDLEAAAAGQEAVDFFLDNSNLNFENIKETIEYNPEFFPSVPQIAPSEEQLTQEAIAEEYAESLVKESGQIPVIVTRRFDPLGDYVTVRMESRGENYRLKLRISINPDSYTAEKGKIKEEEYSRATGPHREILPQQASLH